MGPLNDENKLQVIKSKKGKKTEKFKKYLKKNCIINFKTIEYKLSASGKII